MRRFDACELLNTIGTPPCRRFFGLAIKNMVCFH
jgi:hypothetical protein